MGPIFNMPISRLVSLCVCIIVLQIFGACGAKKEKHGRSPVAEFSREYPVSRIELNRIVTTTLSSPPLKMRFRTHRSELIETEFIPHPGITTGVWPLRKIWEERTQFSFRFVEADTAPSLSGTIMKVMPKTQSREDTSQPWKEVKIMAEQNADATLRAQAASGTGKSGRSPGFTRRSR